MIFRRFSSVLFTLIVSLSLLTACNSSNSASKPSVTLNVFAAASLTDAFNAMKAPYSKEHPDVKLVFDFDGSQQLATQINNEAPADVFASANSTQMDAVIKTDHIKTSSKQALLHNRLIAIMPKDNPGHIQTLQDLTKPGIKLVLADKSVPVGQYALDFFSKASKDSQFSATYQADVLKNVVSYETNVLSVFTKVQLGEADAGIVYTSDVSVKGNLVSQITIPDNLNTIATYYIAPLAASKNSKEADDFITYTLSSSGQSILKQYGFIPLQS
jgi:molybdate transport system substrate-binding protein